MERGVDCAAERGGDEEGDTGVMGESGGEGVALGDAMGGEGRVGHGVV